MSAATIELEYTGANQPEQGFSTSPIAIIDPYVTTPGLDAEIESARHALPLNDDWDGEGSTGYSLGTFDRAVSFVRMHVGRAQESSGIAPPIPRIGPGPGGTIDVHWKRPTWELLVNIPVEEGRRATFYGDDYGAGVIRGSLELDRYNFGLVEWLMK